MDKYKENNLDGINGWKTYPVWNGGGTVKDKLALKVASDVTTNSTSISALDTRLDGLAGRSSYVKTTRINSGKVSNTGLKTSVGRFTLMVVGNAGGGGTIFLL